jgi:outer membrane protein assembly factor BamE (lipoprotein component of BamABCDE complex)
MNVRFIYLSLIILALAACGSIQRSDDAAEAKVHMVGMSRQDVLECMGPPKKKAHQENTEVWSYASTDGTGGNESTTVPIGSIKHTSSQHDRSFCTVNVVMRDGVVTRVNYNGPSGIFYAPDEQCGFAVANCVTGNRF